MHVKEINSEALYSLFDEYKSNFSKTRRIKHCELLKALEQLNANMDFEISNLGESVEKRAIKMLKWGSGEKKILMWTQMHGDEPTATLSILDTLNFLIQKNDFQKFKDKLKSSVSIYIIPMLNPDGAQRGIRRNALGIDLNRDAKKLTSPESQILMDAVISIKPDFAFNLHDQDIRWACGDTHNLATISVLAPPFNFAKTIDAAREKSIKLNVKLFKDLNNLFPDKIAKYSDDHEPRSFGDSIAGMNASTILIEAGRHKNDPDKEIARRLCFTAFLTAFNSIMTDDYLSESIKDYELIPGNGKVLFELIFRNVTLYSFEKEYTIDIAVDIDEFSDGISGRPYQRSLIQEIGDLNKLVGIKEIDCSGLEIKSRGKLHGDEKDLLTIGERADFILVKNGKTKFIVENGCVEEVN